MAKTEVKKVSRIKAKKKLWFTITAPKIFGNKDIGESYLSAPASAVGRTLKSNLRELTGNVRDQNVYISFRIIGVEGNLLRTSSFGYELTPAYVKRMVRKNTSRIDDYFALKTKDDSSVIVKTLLITRNRIQRSVRTELRKQLKEQLEGEISSLDFDTLLSNFVTFRVQMAIKKRLGKVYPLKEVAIRVLQLKGNRKAVSEPLQDAPALPVEV